MSWSYLQEVAGGSMAVCCSDTLPYAPSRLSPKTGNYCCNASETESCPCFLFGTTCAHSTASPGAESLMLSAVDFLAQTSALPEKAQESKVSKADSGGKWLASLARFDQCSRSWRTVQPSLLGDSDECSVIWPRSGMTVGGLAYPLPTAGRHTAENESGFLRTVKASDSDRGGMGELLHQVKTGSPRGIPTPKANDAEKRGDFDATNPRNGLPAFAKMWPTPNVCGGGNPPEIRLEEQKTGRLNPTFVEWLMGWPIGSTAFSPLEMDRFREFMQQHGRC